MGFSNGEIIRESSKQLGMSCNINFRGIDIHKILTQEQKMNMHWIALEETYQLILFLTECNGVKRLF